MIRWARQSGVLLIALSTGCATAVPSRSFSHFLRPGSRTPSPTHELEETPRTLAETPATDSEAGIEADIEVSAKGPIRHDPATRMLIEAELRDATPADRAEWIAFLNTIETSRVPHVLHSRRISEGKDVESVSSPNEVVAASSPEHHEEKQSELKSANVDAHSFGQNSQVVVASAIANEPQTAAKNPPPDKIAPPDLFGGSGWPKRIKSLAEPNWLWPYGNDSDPAAVNPQEKPDRPAFGLPMILGSHPRHDPNATPGHVVTPPASLQVVTSEELKNTPAPTPRLTPGSQLWEDEMQKLISLLEAETSSLSGSTANQEEVRKQVALRLLYLIQNEPQKSQQFIPGLPRSEQEFWTELFTGLSEYLDESGTSDPGERATQTIAHLRTAAYQLQQTAKLRIKNISFCEQIQGFGSFEPFQTNDFSPGQTVLVYAEIRNFQSELTASGNYRTRIRSTIEFYTGGSVQQLVDRNTFDATEDYCRTLRSDYFHSYRIALPLNLAKGPHLLKLVLQDEISGKIATETIPLTIR